MIVMFHMTTEEFQLLQDEIYQKLSHELNPHLYYHKVEHTVDVMEQSLRIAIAEGVTNAHDLLLLKVACLFHDTGFLVAYKGHEQASCEILRKRMLNNPFSEADIQKMEGMIMSTRIPQSPKTLLEKVICDADLDYLGRDDFPIISKRLCDELIALGKIKDPAEFDQIQIAFFEAHEYWTLTSLSERAPVKWIYLQQLKQV